jgi:hypothetical protein
VTTEQEARDADYDGDGIPNWFEVKEIFSDPLDQNSAGGDSNTNGLPDGRELYYFGALGVANPTAVLQPRVDEQGVTGRPFIISRCQIVTVGFRADFHDLIVLSCRWHRTSKVVLRW